MNQRPKYNQSMQLDPQRQTNEVRNFLLSPYFSDGVRITIGVLLPSLILYQFDLLHIGVTISLGALCVSTTDIPGPIAHRRNAMIVTTIALFFVALFTGLGNVSTILSAVLIAGFSFVFSMTYIYGTRVSFIGTACLLVMTLSIDDVRPFKEIVFHALFILGGATWYTLLSLSINHIMPYRHAQLILGDYIFEVSRFMRVKADFYKESFDYDETYTKLVELQIVINEKQEGIRDLLFKTREIIQDSTQEGRFLVLVFVDMVDLLEQIMSTFYNYKKLHKEFDNVGILSSYEAIIIELSEQIENIAHSLKMGIRPHISPSLPRHIATLKNEIASLDAAEFPPMSLVALTNIEVNIENIYARIKKIVTYFKERKLETLDNHQARPALFVNHQEFEFGQFTENLSFNSHIFRHALRVGILMLLGFVIAHSFNFLHSNWILLTIMVIMKPGFSMTKERNLHRLIGTILGAIVGMLISNWVKDDKAMFAILLVCMLGTYSFQRRYYGASVFFMTPFILILYNYLGMGNMAVLQERVYDTLIGGAIAFAGSYFLFPQWESQKVRGALIAMLEANLNYYHQVARAYLGGTNDQFFYKIHRKEVYVASANLASTFQRMFSEPKSKQVSMKEIHKFSVLNHLLTSYIVTLALYAKEHTELSSSITELEPIFNNTEQILSEGIHYLHNDQSGEEQQLINLKQHSLDELSDELYFIPEQFANIQKVALDIYKIVLKVVL